MRNSSENIPLISTNDSLCDDTISMPSMTTPPPYSDGRATPRPQTILTPPTTTDTPDDQPVLNIYAKDIDAEAIQNLFERYRKTGDVAPTINLHVGEASSSGNGEDDGDVEAQGRLEQMNRNRGKKQHERFKIFMGHLTALFGMIMSGFIVWAIVQGVVAIARTRHQ